MIKEYIRIVNKETQETALEKLNIALTELQDNFDDMTGLYTTTKYIGAICEGIASVIVAFTTETAGKEWTRSKAVSRANKFDLETIRTFKRGYGVCGDLDSCLVVELHKDEVGSQRALNEVVRLFHKILATDNILKQLSTRGMLLMAELLHICQFTDIDVQNFK